MELPSSINCSRSGVNIDNEPIKYKVSAATLLQRFLNARKCISSKSAWILLVFNFVVAFLYAFWYPPDFVARDITRSSLRGILYEGTGFFLHLLYPLAGMIADNKIGRHRITQLSTWMLVPGILLALLMTIIAAVTQSEAKLQYANYISLFVALAFLTLGIAGFEANSIQFGIDQLLDSPWEDQSIFIHWYVWVWSFTEIIFVLFDYLNQVDYGGANKELVNKISSAVLLTGILSVVLLLLFLTYFRKRWFLTDSRRHNPYKLVYRVTKFSRLHKVPVNRSAFTYCEDEIPSGLDLAKTKYGGPFKTEEVEDVKAFYGILKVIFTIGPASLLFGTFFSTNDYYRFHFTFNQTNTSSLTAISGAKIAILEDLNVFIIPLYLFILRPFVSYYIPSMLKRMAVGIVVPTLLAAIFLVIDSLAHAENRTLECMFYFDIYGEYNPANWSKLAAIISHYFLYINVISLTVSNLTKYMVHVALFEFICSQSPHSMKGLLIGLSFAIAGLYGLLGTMLAVIFHFSWNESTFPSCCMAFFLINVILGLVALSLYVYVTRGYQYRMRDEPCHVHRYVEEYYSKIQEEDNY